MPVNVARKYNFGNFTAVKQTYQKMSQDFLANLKLVYL